MRLRFGSRGLPPEAYDAWRASLAAHPEAPARILAWARSDGGLVVGSPALLSVLDDAPRAGAEDDDDGADHGGADRMAADEGSGWRHVPWHLVEHGGWNAESRSLSWTLYGGRRGRVGLSEPGRLPELFRERVAATIVVERFVPIRGERGVTITARRDLGEGGGLSWHSSLTRGLTWSAEGVEEEAARATAELQSEYGPASAGW